MLNNKNYAIMKNLKELKENCILIAEYRVPAFTTKKTNITLLYSDAIKCAIYSDDKGKFYVYKYITERKIEEHYKYENAAESFNNFVNKTLL